jgi:hypothetical protein
MAPTPQEIVLRMAAKRVFGREFDMPGSRLLIIYLININVI